MSRCDLGVGCEEASVCYAMAHGEPERCGQARPAFIPTNVIPFPVKAAPKAVTYKPTHGGYPDPKDKQ
jgi:hypothetical protein